MGKVITDMIQGAGRWARYCLVMILTLATTMVMPQGWYSPSTANAAISELSSWTNVHNATTAPGTLAYAMSPGNNRMLVVAVSQNLTAAATSTITVTYGGQSMTKQITNETTSARNHVWLFYLQEAGIRAAINSNLVFTISGGTTRFYQVNAAVYGDVDQSASPISSSQVFTNDGTAANPIGAFATALSIGTNELAVEIFALTRYASTTPRTLTTPATGWSSALGPVNLAATDSINLYMLTDTTAGTTTSSHAISNTSNGSMAAMSIKPYTLATPGAVSVSPIVGTFTSGSPTITTPFTSSMSAVTSCQFTTNGTTWANGTLSGTAPNYTCTATPSGLSGSATINMRATNTGGTATATAVTYTADGTAPTDGTLTVLPGNPSNGIFWTAATDAGIGLDHYDVYAQAGATPPACGGGTLVYTGKWRVATHSGLSASTQYAYRVCATDKMGNVSSGANLSVTTTARPSVVNTCGSCHGYPPVDNAARVGGTTGQFQGSHNKHSGSGPKADCTACHANNTVFGHSNDIIDISLGTGSYSRGTAPPVSNTFTPGNCSNTYCHSNGTGATSQTGDTRTIVANTSPTWGGTTTCTSCHSKPPAYANYTGSTVTAGSKANAHQGATHSVQTCDVCHSSVATSDGGATYTTTSEHADGAYTLKNSLGYSYNRKQGGTCATPGCHQAAAWGGKLGCIDCHSQTIARTKGRAAGTTLGAVVGEFGLAWGHKKAGRATVADDDCIVCHLEGDGTTHKASTTYHMDGNIDLRDPDGAGETPIKNMSGGAFTFQRFSTSFAAGSRSATGGTSNSIDNVITQKFCLACHDGNGATNTFARSNNGGTGTASMPFGGVALGANYTATNGAIGTQGLINVFQQFSSNNSSRHPVRAPNNRNYPYSNRLAAPYVPGTGRDSNTAAGNTATPRTFVQSVVLYCFDCHNTPAVQTLRTVTAHGSATEFRGTYFAASPTLCTTCHIGNATTTTGYLTSSQHGNGSGFATGNSNIGSNTTTCHNCHFSSQTAPARPIKAADVHGFNGLLATGGAWTYGAANGMRPISFIRNTAWSTTSPRPYNATVAGPGKFNLAAGQSTCGGAGTIGSCGNQTHSNYSPGGSF